MGECVCVNIEACRSCSMFAKIEIGTSKSQEMFVQHNNSDELMRTNARRDKNVQF